MNESTLEDEAVLAALVGDTGRFLDEHWNRSPTVHRRAAGSHLEQLLTLDDAQSLLSDRALREPYLRMSKSGRAVEETLFTREVTGTGGRPFRVADVDRIADRFDAGATVILDAIDHYWEPVRQQCEALSGELLAPVEATAFLTPPDTAGLSVHCDNTEVFVVQTYGSKFWRVYEQLRPLVANGTALPEADLAEPVLEVELHPGDCLYIPWGSPHSARSGSVVSCHLSFMVQPLTYGAMLESMIGQAARATEYDAFPELGAGSDQLADAIRIRGAQLLDRMAAPGLDAVLAEQLAGQRRRPFPGRGFLRQAALRAQLSTNSRVSRDPAVPFEWSPAAAGKCEVSVAGTKLLFPALAQGLLEELGSCRSLRLADSRSQLSDRQVLATVQSLASLGALVIEAT